MTGPRNAFLIILLVAASVAMAWLLAGLWQPIFWAVVLGMLFHPLQVRMTNRLGGRRSLSAAIIVVLVFLFLIVPAILLAALVVEQAAALVERVSSGEIDPGDAIRRFQGYLPRLEELAARVGLEIETVAARLRDVAARAGEFTLTLAVGAGQNAARVVLAFFLMLYLMYFILRDGAAIYGRVYDAVPLAHEQKHRFFDQFAIVSVATLKGTVAVGVVQGTLGGLAFAVLGIQGAVFWGAVMALVSVLPALGATLVWFPAAIILAATGSYVKALILLAFGTFVISMVDNLLRPILVGHETKMPDYLVLFSTLGGLATFGITGFVVGPVIAAFFLVAWQIFSERDA